MAFKLSLDEIHRRLERASMRPLGVEPELLRQAIFRQNYSARLGLQGQPQPGEPQPDKPDPWEEFAEELESGTGAELPEKTVLSGNPNERKIQLQQLSLAAFQAGWLRKPEPRWEKAGDITLEEIQNLKQTYQYAGTKTSVQPDLPPQRGEDYMTPEELRTYKREAPQHMKWYLEGRSGQPLSAAMEEKYRASFEKGKQEYIARVGGLEREAPGKPSLYEQGYREPIEQARTEEEQKLFSYYLAQGRAGAKPSPLMDEKYRPAYEQGRAIYQAWLEKQPEVTPTGYMSTAEQRTLESEQQLYAGMLALGRKGEPFPTGGDERMRPAYEQGLEQSKLSGAGGAGEAFALGKAGGILPPNYPEHLRPYYQQGVTQYMATTGLPHPTAGLYSQAQTRKGVKGGFVGEENQSMMAAMGRQAAERDYADIIERLRKQWPAMPLAQRAKLIDELVGMGFGKTAFGTYNVKLPGVPEEMISEKAPTTRGTARWR